MEETTTTASRDDWEKFLKFNAVRCDECLCAPASPKKLECSLCHANHKAGVERILKAAVDKRKFCAKTFLAEAEIIAALAWFDSCAGHANPENCNDCLLGKPCESLSKKLLRAVDLIKKKRHEKE